MTNPMVPILMYHGISEKKRNGIHPYYETNTTPKVFAEQMQFLKKNKYQVGKLKDLSELFKKRVRNMNKFIVLTFDDGLLDFYQNGFPILNHAGFSSTVFVSSGLIGKETTNAKYMSWDQLHELNQKGVIFGSHSESHAKLIELDWSSIELEVAQSKKEIEEKLNASVESFSFPYAFPENDVRFKKGYCEVLQRSGYMTGVTTIVGRCLKSDLPFLIKRIPINMYDDERFFAAKLEGAYDWIHDIQFAYKMLRGRRHRANSILWK